jgi:hypothetical protein
MKKALIQITKDTASFAKPRIKLTSVDMPMIAKMA